MREPTLAEIFLTSLALVTCGVGGCLGLHMVAAAGLLGSATALSGTVIVVGLTGIGCIGLMLATFLWLAGAYRR